jgi:hypothetical protein
VDHKLIAVGKLDNLVITGLLTQIIRNNRDITRDINSINDINMIEIIRMLISVSITTGGNQKSLSINGILFS